MTLENKTEFAYLQKLCRIACSEEEEVQIQANLLKVLSYIEQLNEVNTDHVEPVSYVLRALAKKKLREDTPIQEHLKDRFLANAPDQIGGMIRIPSVLKPQ